MLDMSDLSERQIAAFWTKVSRDTPDKCWNWAASRDKHQYGRYRSFKAHRIAYYLTHGSIDSDLVVMHSCDNPSCCNPTHLLLGTTKDNMADMWRKGRARPMPNIGESNGVAKLNETAIRLIRQSTGRGAGAKLARHYGVTETLICRIRKFKCWKHVQ